ncbi:hypothetical protein [Sinomonas sp. B1-1]|uniref:hypothetical protein n=1 Tax=Sinomonas sp. B1-1 TaxID=3141454 RepID=UPI003D2C7C4D
MNHQEKTSHRPSARRFALHGLEMVIAMLVGMVVLGTVWSWLGLSHDTAVESLVMATDMAIAMAVWMRFRGHGLPAIVEMSAAMYVPFLALLPFYWTGALSAMDVMSAGHVLMLPAMLASMLRRRHEYGW